MSIAPVDGVATDRARRLWSVVRRSIRCVSSGRRRSAWLLGLTMLAACGGPAHRDCPPPIGRIALEDCDVWRRDFEALAIDVRLLLGATDGRVSVSDRPLRAAPQSGEALDVLAHRLANLCDDHNACRTAPDAWRAERTRLDGVLSSLVVLRDRLRDESDPDARRVLAREIDRVARRAAGPAPAEEARRHYSSWLPWFGAHHLPPQPDPPVRAPRLVGVDFDTAARFVSGQGRVGYGPRARVDLWWPGGTFALDDAVVMRWSDGHVTDCPVRGRGNGRDHTSVGCHAAEDRVFTGDTIAVQVAYRTGVDGVEHPIGQASAPVVAHRVDGDDKPPTWDVDLDPLAREGRLVWRPHDRALPARVDQPSLWVVLKLRAHARPTARCTIGGADAFGVLKPGRASGQEGTHQDRPRYRKTSPNSSVSVKDPFVEWWRFDFPLPFGVARDGAELPEGLAPWPRAGEWRCRVTLDGEPVRRLRFTVRPDGQLDLHPEQARAARAHWLLHTEVVPSTVEEPL